MSSTSLGQQVLVLLNRTRLSFGLALILTTQFTVAETYTIGELIDSTLKNSTAVANAQAQADQANSI